MASLGHVAVGLAAGRLAARDQPRARWMILGAVLALAPDLDAVGFALGIPYAAEWGHRGAAHSPAVALALGLVVGLATRRAAVGVWVATVVATHGLLDALTNGGLGVALGWPVWPGRVFFSWRPLPVAPIGAGMLSARGLRVVAVELLWFAPLLAWALWPRRRR